MSDEEIGTRMSKAVSDGDVATVVSLAPDFLYRSRQNRSILVELDQYMRMAIRLQPPETAAQVVEALIGAGADLSHQDSFSRRPLHDAAECAEAVVLRPLIRASPSLIAVDHTGRSAVYIAAESKRRESTLALIEAGASVNRPAIYNGGSTPLHVIAHSGDSVVMAAALTRGAGRPRVCSSNGWTPLHVAAMSRNAGCLRLLCNALGPRESVDLRDHHGLTPLSVAVMASAVDCVNILLQNGADPNTANNKGLTPLFYTTALHLSANRYCDSSIISMLLTAGADVRRRDIKQRTLLHCLAESGNTMPLGEFISRGAELNAVEKTLGETALNVAAVYQNVDVMSELIEAGCDVNIPDIHGVSPLHKFLSSALRVISHKYKTVDQLLQYGARVNAVDDRYVTPLQSCVFHCVMSHETRDGLAVLRRLASAGAYLRRTTPPITEYASNQRGFIRNSPLCWLTWHGQLTAAAFLVNAGWKLSDEQWIELPGKTAAMESFLVAVREAAVNPILLSKLCRSVVRDQLQQANGDRDLVGFIKLLPLPNQLKNFLMLDTEPDFML